MQIVAIIQTYNEQRFIGDCIDHLAAQGVSAYLIDNESTDDTVAIAEARLDKNLIGIETLARDGHFALRNQLARKEQLAQSLDADWFIHLDADEFRVSPDQGRSLAQSIAELDEAGFNAVNSLEFTFMPTREAPDHDHPDFLETMRSYYPFLPKFPHRLNIWKRQDGPVDLMRSGGHVISFPDLKMAPRSMYSRHYLFLGPAHVERKFGPGRYASEEVAAGWFGWRSEVNPAMMELPSERELRRYVADHLLDPSEPRTQHIAKGWVASSTSSNKPTPSWRRRPVAMLRRAAKRGRRVTRTAGKQRRRA